MITTEAINYKMMREFHELDTIKTTVVIISYNQPDDWLSSKTTNIQKFVLSFAANEFEYFFVQNQNMRKTLHNLIFLNNHIYSRIKTCV